MTMIEDTSKREPIEHLGRAMAHPDGTSGYIKKMEAEGQQQLVNSDVIPTDCPANKLVALGFTLGDEVEDDPLFRHATLPEGWRREPSDHSMWSYIVDQNGRRRVSIFYKAAFYDRRAKAGLETLDQDSA